MRRLLSVTSTLLLVGLNLHDFRAQSSSPRKDLFGDRLPQSAIARLGTIRLRPGAHVSSLAFSPDGKKLACWAGGYGTANALAIYEVASGRELRWTPLLDMRIHGFAWLADGRGLALLQLRPGQHKYLMWEFTNEPTPRRDGAVLDGNTSYDGQAFALSPDGRWLASAGRRSGEAEQPLQIRRWESGRSFDDVKPLHTLSLEGRQCRGLLFSADGKTLLAFCRTQDQKETEFLVIDPERGKPYHQVTLPDLIPFFSMANHVAVDLRQGTLAVGPSDAAARVVDLATGKDQQLLPFPRKWDGRIWTSLNAVRFSPNGRYLAAAEFQGPLHLWDLARNRQVWEVPSIESTRFRALAYSPDSRLLAAGGHGAIQIWETETGKEMCPQDALDSEPWGLVVAADARTVVSASTEPALRAWDLSTGKLVQSKTLSGTIQGLALDPLNQSVLVSRDNRLERWNISKNEIEPMPWIEGQGRVGLLRFSADGKRLASVHKDRVSIWGWPHGKLSRSWSLADSQVPPSEFRCWSFALSQDGQQLVAVTNSRQLEVWDTNQGLPIRKLRQDNHLGEVHFVPDQSALVLTSHRSTFREPENVEKALAWVDAKSGESRRFFQPPPNRHDPIFRGNLRVAFSPNGRVLASAENNHTVVLFEAATASVRCVLAGHRNNVSALAFTPDGRRLITFSADHTGLVWDVTLASAAAGRATPQVLNKAWDDLTNRDSGAAVFQAMAAMAASPEDFLELGRGQK